MQYQKFGQHYMIRLDRGEEVIASLKNFCRQEAITAAEIVGLGATDEVTIGIYQVETRTYHKQTFTGEFEITNLTGDVSQKDNEVYLHLHITCGKDDFSTFGGHLDACRISGTCELHLTKLDGLIGRQYDETTGLNIYRFTE